MNRKTLLECVVVAAFGLPFAGCASTGRSAFTSDPEYRLNVVYIDSACGLGSGFPINENEIVTAAHGFPRGLPAGAVLGLPASVTRFKERLGQKDRPRRNDWVVMKVQGAHFQADIIDPDLRPAIGQRVLVGGFPYEDLKDGVSLKDLKPFFVTGRVVQNDNPPDRAEGLVFIEVKEHAYHGFSGGPAALVPTVPGGVPRVFGVAVWAGYLDAKKKRMGLGVAPLTGLGAASD